MVQQSIDGSNDQINRFRNEFERLRANFDTGVLTSTALVMARAAHVIDEISVYGCSYP